MNSICSKTVELRELFPSNCSITAWCFNMWMFKYFMKAAVKSHTSHWNNFWISVLFVFLESRNAFFLMAFLLIVKGLAFFLVIMAGLFTLHTVELRELFLSNCSTTAWCFNMWMFKYFMKAAVKSHTSHWNNFWISVLFVFLESRNAFFLIAFLLIVKGLAFFLVIMAVLFTLVSRENEKELPMEREKLNPWHLLVSVWQKSKHCTV